jgi:hypothetical protein
VNAIRVHGARSREKTPQLSQAWPLTVKRQKAVVKREQIQ